MINKLFYNDNGYLVFKYWGKMKIIFLPWVDLENEVQLGDFIFWKYWDKRNEIITDNVILQQCDNLFSRFKSTVEYENPLNIIVISVYEDSKIKFVIPLNYYSKLRKAINALTFIFLSRLYRDNKDVNLHINVDAFQVMEVDMYPDGYSIIEGRITDFNPWEHKKNYFKSGHIQAAKDIYPEPDLFKAFTKGLNSVKNRKEFNRILKAIEVFNFSYSHSPLVYIPSKIVLVSTAFEILLKIPNISAKKKILAEEVGSLLGKDKGERSFSRNKDKETRNMGKLLQKQWWLYDFYDLRNSIVHGDNIRWSRFYKRKRKDIKSSIRRSKSISHLDIAGKYFRRCVIKRMEDLGFYKDMWEEAKEEVAKVIDKLNKSKKLK